MGRVGSLTVALALCAGLLTQPSVAQAQGHAERKVINRIAPVYPELAKRMHVSGAVKLEVVIQANGNVRSVGALGGNPLLIQAATVAVRKWRFETAPAETTQVIELKFEVQ
jgi:TonB family protein